MKTVLVTGGAGFVGSNLIEALLKDAHTKVYSLDNYSTGLKQNHIPGATYIEGDTNDIDKLVTITPDLIFHLGEYARVSTSFEDLPLLWRSNKDGTFAVLQFARAHKAKLVYAGSSTKFADGGLGRNQSPYAWAKASNTELVMNFGAWFNLRYAITYFYNVYGPRERSGKYGTVIEIFKQARLLEKPLPVVSPGTQTRNFTHVDDIVRGLLLVGEKGEGDGYGLGTRESHSVLDIARAFTGGIEMLPEEPGNRQGSPIDLSRSEGELGWHAEKSVMTYISDFLKSLS